MMIEKRLLCVLCVVTLLSGCASPASKDGMVIDSIANVQQHNKTVLIKTQGGKETGAADTPNISNNSFSAAIEESVINSGIFTQVIHGDNSDYILNVAIINMSKPLFGASFTVSMEAAWSLSDSVTKKMHWRESITSSHTATMGDSMMGVKRLRLAVEGAARENIRLGLMAISKLDLNSE